MNRNERKAFIELKKMGVPVFETLDPDFNGAFLISGEEGEDPDRFGFHWCDYWSIEYDRQEEHSRFGISLKILDVLDDYDLIAEWHDPGTVGVYKG